MTSTDLMNVSAFENQLPDAAFASLNPQDENLSDGIGSSYGIVGYRGKVWSLRLRGENYTFTRPDDGSPAAFLDVIVLRSANYKSKSYYPAGSFDQDSSGTRPTCSALDGVTPDSDIAAPQSQACAICPRNEWKLNAEGHKGRDCTDYKRLAVLILPSQSAALLGGAPLMEPVFLRVPAASLNDLAIIGDAMSKKGFHFSTYITRIGFNAEKSHPQMTFRALQKLSATEAPIVIPMREDPQALRITGESEVGKQKLLGSTSTMTQNAQQHRATSQHNSAHNIEATAATRTTTGLVGPESTTQARSSSTPAAGLQASEDDEEAALLKQLAAAKAKKALAAKIAAGGQTAKEEKVDTGFGGLSGQVIPPDKTGGANASPGMIEHLGSHTVTDLVEAGFEQPGAASQGASTTAATANTIADTGPADEADDDLDARVAGLLSK
jgi:hypothetical protein